VPTLGAYEIAWTRRKRRRAVDVARSALPGGLFGSTQADANYDPQSDFNRDGSVDVQDLLTLAGNFERSMAEISRSRRSGHVEKVRFMTLIRGTSLAGTSPAQSLHRRLPPRPAVGSSEPKSGRHG